MRVTDRLDPCPCPSLRTKEQNETCFLGGLPNFRGASIFTLKGSQIFLHEAHRFCGYAISRRD